MIVLDTTVLVHAVGGDHPFRDLVRSRRRSREDAVGLGRAFTDLLAPLLVVDEPALLNGLRIYGRSGRLGSFDAVLAAASVACDATAIVSADAAFGEVVGLDHVVPDPAGVAKLVSGKPN